MNSINKNIELFINILGMARTSTVLKWDKEALLRAFRWAQYFEQVMIYVNIVCVLLCTFDIYIFFKSIKSIKKHLVLLKFRWLLYDYVLGFHLLIV